MATDKLVDFDHVTDYISREDAVQCANDLSVDLLNDGLDSASYGAQAVSEWLKDVPAADVVEVVRAVWLAEKDGVGICSNCKRLDHIDPLATHCRYCGADMREVKADG